MNRSMPGLPVHHQLLEFTQTHVHRVLSLSIESYMEFLQSFQSGLEKAVSLRLDPRAQQSGLQGLEKSFEK